MLPYQRRKSVKKISAKAGGTTRRGGGRCGMATLHGGETASLGGHLLAPAELPALMLRWRGRAYAAIASAARRAQNAAPAALAARRLRVFASARCLALLCAASARCLHLALPYNFALPFRWRWYARLRHASCLALCSCRMRNQACQQWTRRRGSLAAGRDDVKTRASIRRHSTALVKIIAQHAPSPAPRRPSGINAAAAIYSAARLPSTVARGADMPSAPL